jgi:hypothetical protein
MMQPIGLLLTVTVLDVPPVAQTFLGILEAGTPDVRVFVIKQRGNTDS